MTGRIAAGLLLLGGCATGTSAGGDAGGDDASPRLDASTGQIDAASAVPDGGATPPDAAPGPDANNLDAATLPYRHTITIDGTSDFAAADSFGTTSATYAAYLSWDDDSLFVGYDGADIASGDANKWVLVYIDIDPGAGTGAVVGETYNTEQPAFPTGFGAEYYYRWRADDGFEGLLAYDGGVWAAAPAATPSVASGEFFEAGIPLSALGDPAAVGVVTLMLNEAAGVEAAYAGIYAGSFADGYHASIPITRYVNADFAAVEPPNAPSRVRP